MAKIVINKTRITELTPNSVTFEIPAYISRYLQDEQNKDLGVKIGPVETSRTLTQNAKLWALIGEMDKKMNGRRSKAGEMAIYINLIEAANVKTEIFGVHVDAYDDFVNRAAFRYVEPLDQENETIVCRCYYGTSQFNTREMADFIESALDYAQELEVDLTEYEELKFIGGL